MPTLTAELWLPRPREEVFPFFADAHNLEVITPPWLNFKILNPAPIPMRAGTEIDYQLRIRGFAVRWRSEITAWEPPQRFVDAQRRGPYRNWVHEHTFEERDGGTLARDHVEYSVWGGPLVDWLLARRQVREIFTYRERKLRELFGTTPAR
jgi:ligand-binding SRPBCC domain-containing protein